MRMRYELTRAEKAAQGNAWANLFGPFGAS
jgi:hypothetical protein